MMGIKACRCLWRIAVATLLLAMSVSSATTIARAEVENLLLRAIQAGDVGRVERLLEQGVSPNIVLPDLSTPLAWAVDAQHQQIVELLLDAGAVPDLTEAQQNAYSPLLLACARGDDYLVELLLRAGASATHMTIDGVTPMALCAGQANTRSLSLLSEQGVDIDAADERGQTVLMRAAAAANTANVRWLLSRGANINATTQQGFSAFLFAIKSGNPKTAALLLDAGADLEQRVNDGTSAVQLAVYWRQYNIAARLIDEGADLNAYDRNGNQLLHAAVLAGQETLVEQLISAGADANALTAESQVVWRYEVNFTAAPYISYAKTPLMLAAEIGQASMMNLLLTAGANPDFRCGDGSTFLHAAAQSSPEALSLAISHSDDVNLQTEAGDTALHRLLSLGTDKPTSSDEIATMLSLLAEAGASTDIANAKGATAYSIANRAQHRSREAFLAAFGMPNEENL